MAICSWIRCSREDNVLGHYFTASPVYVMWVRPLGPPLANKGPGEELQDK